MANSENPPAKRPLSERLRGMRFMQKRAETSLRHALQQTQQQREQQRHQQELQQMRWVATPSDQTSATSTPLVIFEHGVSHTPLATARAARRSYGRFNTLYEHSDSKPQKSNPPRENPEPLSPAHPPNRTETHHSSTPCPPVPSARLPSINRAIKKRTKRSAFSIANRKVHRPRHAKHR